MMTLTAGPVTALCAGDKPAQNEDAAAEVDHVAAFREQRSMRAAHQRALAALERLEAPILEHEAEPGASIAEIKEQRNPEDIKHQIAGLTSL